MASTPKDLPIWQLHAALRESWKKHNRLVLIAPTGSGKTTQVCQMLLDDAGEELGQIAILQPRRVAARSVAARVAFERGSKLGGEVGYQVRFEDFVSEQTRIRFMTEGVMLRLFVDNPRLNGIRAILFDEFHERNLFSDVALGLAMRLQESERPDLLILVMSATLEAESLAGFLGGCPVLESQGRSFPVDIRHMEHFDSRPAPELAAEHVSRILQQGDAGDILIFMPGMGEIQQTMREVQGLRTSEPLMILPLHGDLPPDQQDLVFAPASKRKVIVSTNVAETSVTIEGVRFVVDSGLARVARYDPVTGISVLRVEPISRASAQQRAGRAGRTAPGECHRLWTLAGHKDRAEQNTPEIRRTDLASMVLLLRSMGVRDITVFKLPDPPDANAVKAAEEMLARLGAFDSEGNVTSMGREMLKLPVHPRYARMLLEARDRKCVRAVALFAALTSGRDLLQRTREREVQEARELLETNEKSDFFTLANAFRYAQQKGFNLNACRAMGVHAQAARLVEQTWEQILDVCARHGFLSEEEGKGGAAPTDEAILRCVLVGFVDHLSLRQDTGSLQCMMLGGRSATLARESVVRKASLFVAAEMRQISGGEHDGLTLLSLASAVDLSWLKEMFTSQIREQEEAIYDTRHRRVACIKTLRYGDLLLGGTHVASGDPAKMGRALAEALVDEPESLPLWNHDVRQWIGRVRLVARVTPDLKAPSYSREDCVRCLARAFEGLSLFKDAKEKPLLGSFKSLLDTDQQSWIGLLAPESVDLGGPKPVKLLFGEDGTASCSLKLHEAFALRAHPTICDGKVPLTIQLQTPDAKKLEVTQDLEQFRRSIYPKHRTALQKKYPSIAWP